MYNPYCTKELMRLFTLEELPELMRLVDKRHSRKDVEHSPLARPLESYKNQPKSKHHKVKKGEFDSGPIYHPSINYHPLI